MFFFYFHYDCQILYFCSQILTNNALLIFDNLSILISNNINITVLLQKN